MTATNEQIKAEAERRRLKQYKAYGGCLPDVGGSLIDHVIEVTREGWKPPEPVDPDVLAYREWVASWVANPAAEEKVLAGGWDNFGTAKAFVAGARYAREQEREAVAALVEALTP
jgi:hypothetical protein